MKTGIILLFVMLFSAECLMSLPSTYVEIYDPKEFQLIQVQNSGFMLGLAVARRQYWVAGGEKTANLWRIARWIENPKSIYYYIVLYGKIGIHEFIFRITYK